MKIFLYKDDGLDLNLDGFITGLNRAAGESLTFSRGKARFRIKGETIRYDDSYKQLPRALLNEIKEAQLSICFTKIPYDNNYFFHGENNLVVVSFYSWELLTTLPPENGALYFLLSLLRFRLPLPMAHKGVTGCINDFLWDKSGIDVGMRSAFLCVPCTKHIERAELSPVKQRLLTVITGLLMDLGAASRNDENVVEYWTRVQGNEATPSDNKFAVFLSYNTKDREDVRAVRDELEAGGVRTWFDEEQLRPGLAWQDVLEEDIGAIECAAVFVGPSGIGPWQNVEMRAFLIEFANRRCPVIPVILRTAGDIPELPRFLRQFTWVDFRHNREEAMARLVWGITGTKPKLPTGHARSHSIKKASQT